jgi:hypothetical protein
VPMLEGNIDHVIGVDTHRDAHAAAIHDRNGGLVAQLELPSSQAGYEELRGWSPSGRWAAAAWRWRGLGRVSRIASWLVGSGP